MARQVLENGVILPAEYSDDWYDDMTSNLTKLDDVIGSDSEKLSSSDVGAAALSNNYNDLDNLPTIPTVNDATLTIQKNGVDVETFTANASSNVTANITVPTKTSDLTNDSNFVDSSNPAVSSGITSAKVSDYDTHIADTDIHVTTADKSSWNTVTSKANDSDVVHKSGDETVAGFKQFANIRVNNSIKAINLDSTTTDLDNCYSDFAPYAESKGGNIQYYYCNTDSGTANISNLPEAKSFFLTSITTRLISNSLYVKQVLINSNSKTFTRYCANSTWSSWVNETDSEYVHKTGNETVGGAKTFSDNLTIYNSDDTVTPKGLTIRNAQWIMGESGGTTVSNISFLDKNSSIPVSILASKGFSGQSYLRFAVRTKDSQNNTYSEEIYYDIDTSGNVEFRSWHDNIISLGTSAYKWKDVQTYKVNDLEPSSLSLPDGTLSNQIDISSYFANTGSGDTNSYIAPANGWIYLYVTACKTLTAYIQNVSDTIYSDYKERSSDGQIRMMLPIQKNNRFSTQWTTSSTVSITKAVFIPCQGNV